MAKNGFRVIDSDLHVIEPRDLWDRYLDPKFRGRIVTRPDGEHTRAYVDGKVLPPYADRPDRDRAWSIRLARAAAERLHTGTRPQEALAAPDMAVAVSFHGNHAVYSDPLAKRYLDNLVLGQAVGQPVEMMLTLGAIVTGGVLSRFPRLRMAFLEGNCSWLAWWLWALDERWEMWGDRELFQQDAKPSQLFRRQCFVSVEPEEEMAKYVIAELGDDNLVVSTDWPHDDSRFPHAIDGFLAAPHLSQDSKRKVLWDNCARLYKL